MGGEHKCPLCSATFTRPQHVGRHLRAHTGDRPYECKECPLRFARSDLLSRHVNKAHPKPEGADKGKNDKRGGRRRSSVSTSNPSAGQPGAVPQHVHHPNGLSHPHAQVTTTGTAPSSSSRLGLDHATAPNAVAVNGSNAAAAAAAAVAARHPHHPEPTAFQAQRMYPNHPLLQQNGANVGGLWSQNYSLAGTNPQFSLLSAQLGADAIGQGVNPQGMQAPYAGSAVDPLNGTHASYDISLHGGGPHLGADYAVKKRACDQCNHSKVRCDCAEPCARCAHRSMQCTYTKQQRSRTMFPTGMPQQANGNLRASFTTIQQPRRGSSLSSNGTSDGSLLNVARPPVPDPQWDGHTDANGMVQQSPASLNIALTPALTHSASPTTTEASGSDRRGSVNSSQNSWPLPGSALDAPFNFGGVQNDSIGLASSFAGTSGFLWGGVPPFDGTGASPNSVAISSEEDDVEPGKARSGLRRNSNASGVWASAIDQLRLDDPQGIMFDVNGNLQFMSNAEQQQHGQQQSEQQQAEEQQQQHKLSPHRLRQTTHPMTHNDMAAQALSRGPSGPDANNLWKLFMDPNALVTPGKEPDANPMGVETPRGLSKSNSMPDLKTPTTQNAPNIPQNAIDSIVAADDNTDMERWLQHIQQRHASFSMDMNAARKVSTGQIANATFASSTSPTNSATRLSCSPLAGTSALQQTLAPERMPSFGPNVYDATTPNANPKTPTDKLAGMGMTPMSAAHGVERPSNKRMASQTLVPDANQKRPSISTGTEDDEGSSLASSVSSSRRSSAQFSGLSLASRVPLPGQLLNWTPTATDTR